jgi:SAM-dependent methyltransferase
MHPWEREYQNPKLVSLDNKPQHAVLKFLRWLKKDQKFNFEQQLQVLDLGCGTGRNANYLADLGHIVHGYDISPTAINIARERADNLGVSIDYQVRSIGEGYPLPDQSIDLILDVTSSNALNVAERDIYLAESARVLKPGGWMFIRALKKDGDTHAKRLIKDYPGPEPDTYVMPGTDFIERVFTREDFESLYQPYFDIVELKSDVIGYQSVDDRKFKRHYWIAYLQRLGHSA